MLLNKNFCTCPARWQIIEALAELEQPKDLTAKFFEQTKAEQPPCKTCGGSGTVLSKDSASYVIGAAQCRIPCFDCQPEPKIEEAAGRVIGPFVLTEQSAAGVESEGRIFLYRDFWIRKA